MPNGLHRPYGLPHLHFITCSSYRRLPPFASARAKNLFVKILDDVRNRYGFALAGYVVMPNHIHLLIGEPTKGTPSTLMQVLKQRLSRRLRHRPRKNYPLINSHLHFPNGTTHFPNSGSPAFTIAMSGVSPGLSRNFNACT
jgi:REP element-mobilizing transposase RayT